MTSWWSPPNLFCEIEADAIRVAADGLFFELPLERDGSGRLSVACKQSLKAGFQERLKSSPWSSNGRLWCAIAARGVSLRKVELPPHAGAEAASMLALKIEGEWPLPAEALAWGTVPLPGGREHLVAAFRRDLVSDFDEVFSACGFSTVYVLGAVARSRLLDAAMRSFALLEIGPDRSEWVVFEEGHPVLARQIAGGENDVLAGAARSLGINVEEARARRMAPDSARLANDPVWRNAMMEGFAAVCAVIKGVSPSRPVFVSAQSGGVGGYCEGLNAGLNVPGLCRPLVSSLPASGSVTLNGLRRAVAESADNLLAIRLKAESGGASAMSGVLAWKRLGVPVALLLVVLLLPWLEPLIFKPRLARSLASLQADKGRLALIDREFGFFQYLKENQAPYTDALFLMATASPGGTRLDGVTMNRRGEVSIRASFRDAQQIGDFRSKLLSSGFFSSVVVEEQSMAQGQQKFSARLTAQWKAEGGRESLSLGPPDAEVEKFMPEKKTAKTNAPPETLTNAVSTPKKKD